MGWPEADFLDLGCSKGGSLRWATNRYGGTGLGIDIEPRKVAAAREAGRLAFEGDATKLPAGLSVRFVLMSDFLEHLPSLDVVEQVIGEAARVATDFLLIRHPSFEGRGFLEQIGLRQYWWNWTGHKSHIQVADYCSMFDRLGLQQYTVRYKRRITHSMDESIVPLSAPRDGSAFVRERDGAKPSIPLPAPVWRSQTIVIQLRPMPASEWSDITSRAH